MMIQLELADEMKPQDLDRLSANRQTERVLDVEVSKVIIPIAAGRNIAVLVEAAVRNHMLLLRGVNATKQLTQRQKQIMLRESKLR
jgi:HPr kinase/phosphorylase